MSHYRTRLRQRIQINNRSVGNTNISYEEDQNLLVEAMENLHEANTMIEDNERLEDIADTLEDVAGVGDTIDDATPRDLIMLEATSRLAVAGSDVDPEVITPALESYIDMKPSMEGMRQMIRDIWEAVKRTVIKLYEKIEAFFYKLFGTIPNMRRNIKSLRKRADKASGSVVSNSKTTLGAEINSLSIDHKPPRDGSQIVGAIEGIDKVTENMFDGEYVKYVIALGETFESSLDSFDAENPSKTVDGLCSDLAAAQKVSIKGSARVVSDTRFNGPVSKIGDIAGNMSLFMTLPGSANTSDTLTKNQKILSNARDTKVQLMSTRSRPKSPSEGGDISTMSTGDVVLICDHIESIIKNIEEYNRGKDWKKVKELRKKLNKSADNAKSDAESAELNSVQLGDYRTVIRTVGWYGRISTQPMASVASHSLKVCRAAMTACNKSMSNYS